MVSFYKHDIPRWMDGVADLSHEAYRAYHVIIQMIYLNEEPVRLNERYLAGACSMSTRAFRGALDELVEAKKVTVSDGKIDNLKCENELNTIRTSRERARTGGEISGRVRQLRKNTNNINGDDEAPLRSPTNREEKTRLEEVVQSPKRETGTKAPQLFEVPQLRAPEPERPTPEAELFRRGRAVLGSKAGGIIQKLLKAKDGSVGMARSVVEAASTKGNPTEYVMGAIQNSIEREHEARAYTNII